jgi:arabinan endo-1,5-alpha-L-arabinosidase
MRDNFNAIDPSVMIDTDKRMWMAFGSFWSGIKLVELDAATGLRKAGAPLHALARGEGDRGAVSLPARYTLLSVC